MLSHNLLKLFITSVFTKINTFYQLLNNYLYVCRDQTILREILKLIIYDKELLTGSNNESVVHPILRIVWSTLKVAPHTKFST